MNILNLRRFLSKAARNTIKRATLTERIVASNKAGRVVMALLVLAAQGVRGQAPVARDVVVERGPHYNVWNRTVQEPAPQGRLINRVHSYQEICSGLNYWSDDQKAWLPSTEEIEIINGSAVARHGQMQVVWAANANVPGAVSVHASDGKSFRSHVLGLAFTDRKTGASAFFATVKDCVAQVIGNQVLYPSAFDGINADILYTYRRSGLEQFILLRENLPDPSKAPWNLDPANVSVEVYTEFIDPPEPLVTTLTLKHEVHQAGRAAVMQADMIDQQLHFGATHIGHGTAFLTGDGADGREIPVAKAFEVRDRNRHCLIEKMEYSSVRAAMENLPRAAALTRERMARIKADLVPDQNGVRKSSLPKAPLLNAGLKAETIQLAQNIPAGNAFVLDYSQLNTATNVTLQADITYYVSGQVSLYGTTTLEGNCVVKFAPTNSAKIQLNGPLVCKTGPYRMAVFTARDDDSVGEAISSGPLTGYYASTALDLNAYGSGVSYDLEYIRICYADNAINFFTGAGHQVRHSQLSNCKNGYSSYWNPDLTFRNVLFGSISNLCGASGASNTTNILENVTLDQIARFNVTGSGDATFFLTNCLLVGVTNTGIYSGANNAAAPVTANVFQSTGAGGHYLAANSAYRNAGTANINAALLADLRAKTTFPPLVYSNATISADTTLGVQAQRDTDTLDLGYHYDPLDYAFGGADVYANLTFSAGTAVGWFRTSSGWYHAGHGIHMDDRKILTFDGHIDAPDYWVRCSMVQEGGTGAWNGGFGPGGITGWADQDLGDVTLSPEIHARFTRFSGTSYDSHFRDDYGYLIVRASDCEFYSGGTAGYVISYYFTNCFLDRVNGGQVAGLPGNEIYLRNCTWRGGLFQLDRWNWPVPVNIRDCAFDNTTIQVGDSYSTDPTLSDYDYNAFLSNASRTIPTGAHDVIVSSFNWQAGLLGSYYLPSDSTLINAGSTTADRVGLFYYCTTTDQNLERNSVVDIGYHYVALNAQNNPIDGDANGVFDFMEDADGDGLTDAQELIVGTNARNFDTNGNGVSDGDEDADGDLLSNKAELNVYHSDPLNPNTFHPGAKDAEYLSAAAPGGNNSVVALSSPPDFSEPGYVKFNLTGAPNNATWSLYFKNSLNPGVKWLRVVRGLNANNEELPPTTHFKVIAPGGPSGTFIALSDYDADLDGVSDGEEAVITKTGLNTPDTDGDDYSDGPLTPGALAPSGRAWKGANDAFPNHAGAWRDTDGDGLPDAVGPCSAPQSCSPTLPTEDADDDNDGIPDTVEIAQGSDPQNPNSLPVPKWYVDVKAPPQAANGTKACPFPTIQAALNVATDYDIIQVAKGIYSGPGNRDLDFLGKKVRVTSAAGWEATTNDVTGGTQGVLFHSGEGASTWLVGFTIKNAAGSAIKCVGASPVIVNCQFINNATGASTASGGGLYCSSASPVVVNCKFINNGNNVGLGAGVYSEGTGKPSISHCTFKDNTRPAGGGQIYARDTSNVGLTNSILWTTTGAAAEIVTANSAIVSRWYSDIKGSSSGDGYFLINADPLFEDTGRLIRNATQISPCIDRGTTNSVFGYAHLAMWDHDGEARLQVTQPPNVLFSADIGSDEFVNRLLIPLDPDVNEGGGNVYSTIDEASGVAFLGENGGYSKLAVIDDEKPDNLYVLWIDPLGLLRLPIVPSAFDKHMKDLEEITYDSDANRLYAICSQTKVNHYIQSDHDSFPFQDSPRTDYDRNRDRIARLSVTATRDIDPAAPVVYYQSEDPGSSGSVDYDANQGLIAHIRTQIQNALVNDPKLNDQNLGDHVLIARNTVPVFADPINGQRYSKGSYLDPAHPECGVSLGDDLTAGELGTTSTADGRYRIFTLDNTYHANLQVAANTPYYFKIWAFASDTDRQYTKTLSLVVANTTRALTTVSQIPKLYINEFDSSATPDWIEIFNPGNAAVDITGFKFANQTMRNAGTFSMVPNPLPHTGVPGTAPLVPAHGFLFLNCNNGGGTADLGFSIADAGDHIYFSYSDAGNGTLIDDLVVNSDTGPAGGRVWDGGEAGARFNSSTPNHPKTKGAANNNQVYKHFDVTSDIDQVNRKIYLSWRNIGQIPSVWKYSPKQQDNYPVNIEGFAFGGRPAARELVVGLRSPLINRDTGNAIYFKASPIATFLPDPPPADPQNGGWAGVAAGLNNGLRQLNLNGQGIRSVTWYASRATYLILAGPANGGPLTKERFDEKFTLYSWDGQPGANGADGNPVATPRVIIPDVRPYAVRPEGVSVFTIGGVEKVVFVEDRYRQAGYATRNVVHWPISILGTSFQSAP